MKILFITMVWPNKIEMSNMYTDLMSEFAKEKHEVTVLALNESRNKMPTALTNECGMRILRVKCGNIQKTNKYKKVISSLIANAQIINAVKSKLNYELFDLMIFALPPVTIAPAVTFLKRKTGAQLYLLLKEFWPQDPTDLKAMKEHGIVWKFFDYLSNMLYRNADYIGTMSLAGIDFMRKTAPWIKATIETCPNCLREDCVYPKTKNEREKIFAQYAIPNDKIVCIMGGNLGISQGIPEMISCMKGVKDFDDYCFLIIGDGTESGVVRDALKNQNNVIIKQWIQAKDYDNLMRYADVGLIFLYPNYSVPNVPSRLVGYLKNALPVMACVDKTTDAGKIVEDANCGYSILNGDITGFREKIALFRDENKRIEMGRKSRSLFEKQFSSEHCYKIIMSHFSHVEDK